jgi:hypothetical protein
LARPRTAASSSIVIADTKSWPTSAAFLIARPGTDAGSNRRLIRTLVSTTIRSL